jgi:hypothetical protein
MAGSRAAFDDAFELISVRSAGVPVGADGSDWHQYVIRQGDNEIRGYQQGTLVSVTAKVEQIVVRLNERREQKPGRTHIVLRGRKPKQQE